MFIVHIVQKSKWENIILFQQYSQYKARNIWSSKAKFHINFVEQTLVDVNLVSLSDTHVGAGEGGWGMPASFVNQSGINCPLKRADLFSTSHWYYLPWMCFIILLGFYMLTKFFIWLFYEKLKNFIAIFCIIVGIVLSTDNVFFYK